MPLPTIFITPSKKRYIWGMLDSAGLGLLAVGMEGSTVVMFSEANFF